MHRALMVVSGVLVALALAPQAGATPVRPDNGCIGAWVGRGRNTGYSTYWTIDLTLTSNPSGGRCGTIRYTNPDCEGFLEDCQVEGDEIHTRESYVVQGRCAPPGEVIIRCEGNRMRYSWLGWERVDSTLTRSGPAQAAQQPAGALPAPSQPVTPAPSQPVTPAPPQPAPSQAQTPGNGPLPVQPAPPPPSASGQPRGSSWFGCSAAAPRPARSGLAWLSVLVALGLARARRRRGRDAR